MQAAVKWLQMCMHTLQAGCFPEGLSRLGGHCPPTSTVNHGCLSKRRSDLCPPELLLTATELQCAQQLLRHRERNLRLLAAICANMQSDSEGAPDEGPPDDHATKKQASAVSKKGAKEVLSLILITFAVIAGLLWYEMCRK